MKVLSIEGLVADASPDGTLIINVGSESGLNMGDMLAVKRVGRRSPIPPPARLRQMEDPIGQMTITEVDANSAL